MKIYNKLVRDKIPGIIESSGKTCKTHILSEAEYIEALEAKLNEEVAEYQSDQNLEELEKMRAKKALERGGFVERIFLEWVE